tara:strand:+ start:511 stop:711 length:201 start_codon:yes stop_codon:yes gene_type:complete
METRNDLDYANSQPNENEMKEKKLSLMKDKDKIIQWYDHFVDYVNQVDPNLYNEACEYSDNAEESI